MFTNSEVKYAEAHLNLSNASFKFLYSSLLDSYAVHSCAPNKMFVAAFRCGTPESNGRHPAVIASPSGVHMGQDLCTLSHGGALGSELGINFWAFLMCL